MNLQMKKDIIIFFILIIISTFLIFYGCSPAHAGDWTKADIAREVAWETIHIIDWGQTLEVARNPQQYKEINSVIGKHPSVGKVNLYMASWAIAHPVISYLLPKKYRLYWQWGSIFVSTGCVINNNMIGLRVRF